MPQKEKKLLITKETDYALRILRSLADAGNTKTPIKEICDKELLPQQFVYKIAKKLAKGLIDSIMFLYNAMVDPKTPLQVKLIAIAALIYLINPFDAIPDVLPGIGFADDCL